MCDLRCGDDLVYLPGVSEGSDVGRTEDVDFALSVLSEAKDEPVDFAVRRAGNGEFPGRPTAINRFGGGIDRSVGNVETRAPMAVYVFALQSGNGAAAIDKPPVGTTMPFIGGRLSSENLALIRDWIDQGAMNN